MTGQAGGVSERMPGITARRLDVLHLSPPGTARSGTPFGVRVLVGLGSGGTAARNPRLPSDTPPGSPGREFGRFSCLCGGFPLSRPETDRPEGLSPRRGIGFQPVVVEQLRHIASTPSKALNGGRPGEWSNLRIHVQRLTDRKVCHHVVLTLPIFWTCTKTIKTLAHYVWDVYQ